MGILSEKPQLGGSSSQAGQSAPAYTTFRTSFASVSLHQTDKLRLMRFPESDISSIREVIKTFWPSGIQNERVYGGSYEFKFHGYPWAGQGKEAIPCRIVMREILAHLFRSGWILHASTDVSKKKLDKDTLIFRKQESPPPDSEWISISFNQSDRLRLIGADQGLIQQFRDMLRARHLLQKESWKDQRLQAWEFKLNGTPWWASGEDTMTTRFLLLGLLEVLEGNGWSLYASFDQSTSSEDASETDSWYCVRQRGWTPGSAVFHR